MLRRLNGIFLSLFLFTLFALTIEARADGVVITGGGATQSSGSHTYDLTGQGFRASGWGYFGRVPCQPCGVSSSFSLSNSFVGEDSLKYGPATFNGTDYPMLWYTGSINFATDSYVLTADSPTGEFTITMPFTLTGHLNAYYLNPFAGNPGPAVFSLDLSGEGIASVLMYGFDTTSGRRFNPHGIAYSFQTTPTPEPATLLLLGTGLAGIALKGYRRNRKRERS